MMKKLLLTTIMLLLLGTAAEGQGVELQVYNDWNGNQGIKFSTGDIEGWKGQDFTTGSNPGGYTLDRIEWRFKDSETGDQIQLWYVPPGSGDEIGRTTAGMEPLARLDNQEVQNTEPAEADRANHSNELWRGIYRPRAGETVILEPNSTYIVGIYEAGAWEIGYLAADQGERPSGTDWRIGRRWKAGFGGAPWVPALNVHNTDENDTSTHMIVDVDANYSFRMAVYATPHPAGVPGTPTNLTATSTYPTTVALSWTAPIRTGGSPITGYKIEYTGLHGRAWETLEEGHPSTSYTHTHDFDGTQTDLTYRVSAINAHGAGDYAEVTVDLADPSTTVTNENDSAYQDPNYVSGTVNAQQVVLTFNEDLDDRLGPACWAVRGADQHHRNPCEVGGAQR